MRRLALALLGAALLCGCSASIPRHPAAFITPTEPPPTPIDQPTGTPGPTADTSGWITVAPDGAGFSVLMPGAPTSNTQELHAQVNNVTVKGALTTWTFTDSFNHTFGVTLVKFADGTFAGTPSTTALDGAAAQISSGLTGARIVSQSDITLGTHAGRRMTYANSTDAVDCEFFFVGDSVYTIGFLYKVGQGDSALTSAFFGSFQLTA